MKYQKISKPLSRTTLWRRRKRGTGCSCKWHQPKQNNCCKYHSRKYQEPVTCCKFHGEVEDLMDTRPISEDNTNGPYEAIDIMLTNGSSSEESGYDEVNNGSSSEDSSADEINHTVTHHEEAGPFCHIGPPMSGRVLPHSSCAQKGRHADRRDQTTGRNSGGTDNGEDSDGDADSRINGSNDDGVGDADRHGHGENAGGDEEDPNGVGHGEPSDDDEVEADGDDEEPDGGGSGDDPDGDDEGDPDGDDENPDGDDPSSSDQSDSDNDSGTNSSSDSEQDENVPFQTFSLNNPALNVVLQMGNGLTKREVIAMVIALCQRHNLNYETMTKFFSIVNLTLGFRQLPDTKKLIWNSLERNWFGIKKHAYCSECYEYLGLINRLGNHVVCCGEPIQRKNLKYFITLNVHNQLLTILNEPGAWERLQYARTREKVNPQALEDILDGECYRRLPRNEYDFSYQFNLDPFSVSKSSNTQVCPIFLRINELPPNLRQKNVVLAALWLDTKSVCYSLFIKVFRKQCNNLSQNGITWRPNGQEQQVSRFYSTCCIADAVGRSGILNISTHSGSCSCPYCLHPGVKLDGAIKFPLPGSVVERIRIARGEQIVEEVVIPIHIEQRTDANIRAAMQLRNRHLTGIIGPAEVALLNHFDLGVGFSTDDLHPVYLGVAKYHTSDLLLEGVPGEYIISKQQKQLISMRMKEIKTPTHMSRKPRGIDHIGKWNGTEWRNWLLFYSIPCLQGIVPERYLRHFGLLSGAIFHLSRDIVTDEDLVEADRLLDRYVNLFQQYFGAEAMRYNVHILTHMVQGVRNWGPLWAQSTMPFESWNHRLANCVSSPKAALDQIAMRYLMVSLLRRIPHSADISDGVKERINFILKGKARQTVTVGKAHFFGKEEERPPTNLEIQLLAEEGCACDRLTVYPQVIVKSFECRSTSYRRDIASVNCFVYTYDDRFCAINSIVVFRQNNQLVGGVFATPYEVGRGPLLGVSHIVPITNEQRCCFMHIANVRNLAFKMCINEQMFITPMANQLEID